jgi:hypothetical protein
MMGEKVIYLLMFVVFQAVVGYYPIPDAILKFLSLPVRSKRDSLE